MAEDRKPMANIPPFGLRMQPELKARIEEAARANNRSLNAEIVARLEDSLKPPSAALLEATLVAESLRENLTARIDNYQRLTKMLARREQELQDREAEAADILMNAEIKAQEILREREEELESDFKLRLRALERREKSADEYASFTIARERQFYEAVKALTGVEPPPVEPFPLAQIRNLASDDDEPEGPPI